MGHQATPAHASIAHGGPGVLEKFDPSVLPSVLLAQLEYHHSSHPAATIKNETFNLLGRLAHHREKCETEIKFTFTANGKERTIILHRGKKCCKGSLDDDSVEIGDDDLFKTAQDLRGKSKQRYILQMFNDYSQDFSNRLNDPKLTPDQFRILRLEYASFLKQAHELGLIKDLPGLSIAELQKKIAAAKNRDELKNLIDPISKVIGDQLQQANMAWGALSHLFFARICHLFKINPRSSSPQAAFIPPLPAAGSDDVLHGSQPETKVFDPSSSSPLLASDSGQAEHKVDPFLQPLDELAAAAKRKEIEALQQQNEQAEKDRREAQADIDALAGVTVDGVPLDPNSVQLAYNSTVVKEILAMGVEGREQLIKARQGNPDKKIS